MADLITTNNSTVSKKKFVKVSDYPLLTVSSEEIATLDPEVVKYVWQSPCFDNSSRFNAVRVQQENFGWSTGKTEIVEHSLCILLMYESIGNKEAFKKNIRIHPTTNPSRFLGGWLKEKAKAVMEYSLQLADEDEKEK